MFASHTPESCGLEPAGFEKIVMDASFRRQVSGVTVST